MARHAQAPTAAEKPAASARPNPTLKLKFEAESEGSERTSRYKLLRQIGEVGGGVFCMAALQEPVRWRVPLTRPLDDSPTLITACSRPLVWKPA